MSTTCQLPADIHTYDTIRSVVLVRVYDHRRPKAEPKTVLVAPAYERSNVMWVADCNEKAPSQDRYRVYDIHMCGCTIEAVQ